MLNRRRAYSIKPYLPNTENLNPLINSNYMKKQYQQQTLPNKSQSKNNNTQQCKLYHNFLNNLSHEKVPQMNLVQINLRQLIQPSSQTLKIKHKKNEKVTFFLEQNQPNRVIANEQINCEKMIRKNTDKNQLGKPRIGETTSFKTFIKRDIYFENYFDYKNHSTKNQQKPLPFIQVFGTPYQSQAFNVTSKFNDFTQNLEWNKGQDRPHRQTERSLRYTERRSNLQLKDNQIDNSYDTFSEWKTKPYEDNIEKRFF